jgi:hypothetical protein
MGRHFSKDISVLFNQGLEFFAVVNGNSSIHGQDSHDTECKLPAHYKKENDIRNYSNKVLDEKG